jgi:hypothetical protein
VHLVRAGLCGSKLWHAICFLARLRKAYYTFLKAKQELLAFGKLSIVSVNTPKVKRKPSQSSLKDTLAYLGMEAEKQTLQLYLGSNKATVTAVESEFMALQQRALHVHCEVQLIRYTAGGRHRGNAQLLSLYRL